MLLYHTLSMCLAGRALQTWRKRWFVLESGRLSYFEDEGGKLKGSVRAASRLTPLPRVLFAFPCTSSTAACVRTNADCFRIATLAPRMPSLSVARSPPAELPPRALLLFYVNYILLRCMR